MQSKMIAKPKCNQKRLQKQVYEYIIQEEVKEMINYVSLIMDVEKSRRYGIEDRTELQNYMSYCVKMLNQLFREGIEYDVTFSAGDELQGLFRDTTAALMYFRLLEMLLKPVKLRAGIGVGEWTIKVNDGLSTQQDGPAYHRARHAIEEVYKKAFHNIRICSDKDDVLANHLINASLTLKNQQIYMQNIVLVILELLCPFVKWEMDVDRYEIIRELIEIKFEYKIGRIRYPYPRKELLLENDRLHFHRFPIIEPIYINGNMKEAEENIIIKNISSYIAEILDCSRQNVDSILRRGNANKIRELDYMALQYIERMYGE